MCHPLKRHPKPAWPSYTGISHYVGTSPSGQVVVYVDPSLGAPALQNAKDLVRDADRVVKANNAFFGSPGGGPSRSSSLRWMAKLTAAEAPITTPATIRAVAQSRSALPSDTRPGCRLSLKRS